MKLGERPFTHDEVPVQEPDGKTRNPHAQLTDDRTMKETRSSETCIGSDAAERPAGR